MAIVLCLGRNAVFLTFLSKKTQNFAIDICEKRLVKADFIFIYRNPATPFSPRLGIALISDFIELLAQTL